MHLSTTPAIPWQPQSGELTRSFTLLCSDSGDAALIPLDNVAGKYVSSTYVRSGSVAYVYRT